MSDDPESSDAPPPPMGVAAARPKPLERVVALLEVLICSDYPTQFAIAATLGTLGMKATTESGALSVWYVVALSFADTAILIFLIVAFFLAHGDDPKEILLGKRPYLHESMQGLLPIFVALAISFVVLIATRWLAPWLHTVPRNPLQDLMQSPRDALIFAVVVVIAGGVREEVQRAFLLNRFERWLGGSGVGVVVASTAFGLGHLLQGLDAALVTGVLGAYWGVIYLRRRSILAPVVSHSGFNIVQLMQAFVAGG